MRRESRQHRSTFGGSVAAAVGLSVLLLVGCGQDPLPERPAASATPQSSSSSTPVLVTPATPDSEPPVSDVHGETDPPPLPDDVIERLADIDPIGLSVSDYERRECDQPSQLIGPGTSPIASYTSDPVYESADAIRSDVDVAALVTIQEVMDSAVFVPVGLAADLDDTARESLDRLQIPYTSVRVRFDDVAVGSPEQEASIADLGCLTQEQSEGTTPGQQVMVLLERNTDGRGPFELLPAEYRVLDYMVVVDGRLGGRSTLLGSPPFAPFLLGLSVEEALTELAR